MDLRQLRYFVAIADAKTFSRAAANLHISQPALSKSIRSLEQSLDVTLVERGAREVTLTTFGKSLYNYAKSIAAELDRAHSELQALRSTPSGTVTVGALRPIATTLLPEVTSRFVREHPTARVKVIVDFNQTLVKALAQGDLDFVIIPVEENFVEKDFHCEFLGHDRLSVICRYGHPLTHERVVTPWMLRQYPWVLPIFGSRYRRRLEDMFFAAGISAPDSLIECTFLPFTRGVLMRGDHLAMVSEDSIRLEIEAKILAILPSTSDFLSRPLGILTRANHILPYTSAAYLRELRIVAALQASLAAANAADSYSWG
jgi:DNA-binding transcriptional LysR family regulator